MARFFILNLLLLRCKKSISVNLQEYKNIITLLINFIT